MIYLLYSEGFRLGGNNSARAAESGVIPPLNYEPDKLSNYEAGLKSQWFDDAVQFNVSLFFMEWDQIQLNASGSNAGNPCWLRGTFNGGKAEQKGVEMNGAWQVTPSFSIEASAFFADPEFSEETVYPDGDTRHPGRYRHAGVAGDGNTGSPSITRCPISWPSTARPGPGSPTATSPKSGTAPDAILDFVEAVDAGGTSRRARSAAAVVLDVDAAVRVSRPTAAGRQR